MKKTIFYFLICVAVCVATLMTVGTVANADIIPVDEELEEGEVLGIAWNTTEGHDRLGIRGTILIATLVGIIFLAVLCFRE